jgi:hypothetical protein
METEKVEPVAHVHHLGFGLRKPQSQRLEHLSDVFAQGLDVRLLAMNEDDEIVCVTDDPPSRLAMDATPAAQVCS